jgi:hypothetical protein
MPRLKNTKKPATLFTEITPELSSDPSVGRGIDGEEGLTEFCQLIEPCFSERISAEPPADFWGENNFANRDDGQNSRESEYYIVGPRVKWFISVHAPWMYVQFFDYLPAEETPERKYIIFCSQPVTNISYDLLKGDKGVIAVCNL